VTVCIAAACRDGEYFVSATDGALSQGGETMDMALTKMYWFANAQTSWQFMYAGEPSNADLVLENVRRALLRDKKALTREKIQHTVRQAFKQRFADWIADYVLAPYNMSMEDFKRQGQSIFGAGFAATLAQQMDNAATSFREELMVIGWGKSPISAMIYGMNQSGSWSGSLVGLGTIGAGRDVAMSSLLLYGANRHSPLEDAIYAVAAAKFSAERCDGVGQHTTICVSRKPHPTDSQVTKSSEFCTPEEVGTLRNLWEAHGKLRVPEEGYLTITKMAQRVSGSVGVASIARIVQGLSKQSATRLDSTD